MKLFLLVIILWNLLSPCNSVSTYLASSYAGVSGLSGTQGDGGKATAAWLQQPIGIFVDSLSNCYISDNSGGVVRKIDSTNLISTFAGTGASSSNGNGLPATSASFNFPDGIWADSLGKFYIGEVVGHYIRSLSGSTSIVSIAAGTGTASSSATDGNGDNGVATAATLKNPYGIYGDTIGSLYVTDAGNNKIRKMSSTAIITTIAGTGPATFTGDGFAASSATINFPQSVFIDTSGNLMIADSTNYRIRKITSGSLLISTIAGAGNTFSDNTDNGYPATAVNIFNPTGVWMDTMGNLFYAALNNCNVRISTGTSNLVYTIAGTGASSSGGDNGPATSASFAEPRSVFGYSTGNLLVTDKGANNVRLLTNLNPTVVPTAAPSLSPSNAPTVIPSAAPVKVYSIFRLAGATHSDFTSSGDGGSSLLAQMLPDGFHAASTGEMYVAENFRSNIRKIDSAGIITALTATAASAISGDGGAVTSAKVYMPYGITANSVGKIYWSDNGGNIIRTVSNGIVSTYAGSTGAVGFGNSVVLTSATLYNVIDLCSDTSGNVYAADATSVRIRMISATTGVSTIAGTGTVTYSSSNKVGTAFSFTPSGVYVDTTGNVFMSDSSSNYLFMMSGSTNIVTTLAGRSSDQYIDTITVATSAAINGPKGVSGDTVGNIFAAASQMGVIRKISSGSMTSIAGNGNTGPVYNGDGGSATAATVCQPYMIHTITTGSIYFVDSYFKVIRLLADPSGVPTIAPSWTPTIIPTASPTFSRLPTVIPSLLPSKSPSTLPTTFMPTLTPSRAPTRVPSLVPSQVPSVTPSLRPTTVMPSATLSPTVSYYSRSYWITAFAGHAGPGGFCCDGAIAATSATMSTPNGLFVSTAGLVYTVETGNNLIRTVDSLGIMRSLNTRFGSTSFGPVSACAFGAVFIVGDTSGGLYVITDFNRQVVKISASGIVSAFAGDADFSQSPSDPIGDGGPATSGKFNVLNDIAIDTAGVIYLADSGDNRVRIVTTTSIVNTIVGSADDNSAGDGGPATSAIVSGMDSVFVDSTGRLFLADYDNGYIRMVSRGTITAVTARSDGDQGEGVLATAAGLHFGMCVRVDKDGNVYVIDQGNFRIRMISGESNRIYTIAFDGNNGYAGDNGPALTARGSGLARIALDTAGNVYVSDYNDTVNTVRKLTYLPAPTRLPTLSPSQYSVARSYQLEAFVGIAGLGAYCCDDPTSGTSVQMDFPYGVFADSQGIVYIADNKNEVIKKVDTAGIVSNMNVKVYDEEFGPISSCFVSLPYAITGDSMGSLYFVGAFQTKVRKISDGNVMPLIGSDDSSEDPMAANGDGGQATAASFYLLTDLWVDTVGNVYLTEEFENKVRIMSVSGIISTYAGTGLDITDPDGMKPSSTSFSGMDSIYVNTNGDVYICDAHSNRIHVVPQSTGIVTRFASIDTTSGPEGDDVPATSSLLHFPGSVRGDSVGNIYFNDYYAGQVRMVASSNNRVYSLGGNGVLGYSGDGGPALEGQFFWVNRIALDTAGNIYVSDGSVDINNVRKMVYDGSPTVAPSPAPSVFPASREYILSTIVGQPGVPDYCCDLPVAGTSSKLHYPYGIWMNTVGKLYVGDIGNAALKVMDTNNIISNLNDKSSSIEFGPITSCSFNGPYIAIGESASSTMYVIGQDQQVIKRISNGVVSPFLGAVGETGTLLMPNGDGGPGTSASFGGAFDFWLDTLNNLYFADSSNNKVRRYSADGILSTYVGTGNRVEMGDAGQATSASVVGLDSMFVDSMGKMYLTDFESNTIRLVSSAGIITHYAGSDPGVEADDVDATSVKFNLPGSLRGDTIGNLYFLDQFHYSIRMIAASNTRVYTLGGGNGPGVSGDGSPATLGQISYPFRIGLDTQGNIYYTEGDDNFGSTVRKMTYVPPPTVMPTRSPTNSPTTKPTNAPTVAPSISPSASPTVSPTAIPTAPTVQPSASPSASPSAAPSVCPTLTPSVNPSIAPSNSPTVAPSTSPTVLPTVLPTLLPTVTPSVAPTVYPSLTPTTAPSLFPTLVPSTVPTDAPTLAPSLPPTCLPTILPTVQPSLTPSLLPTANPSVCPSIGPTVSPSTAPSVAPSLAPTVTPTVAPTISPSLNPTIKPSVAPTQSPSVIPTLIPSIGPTVKPSVTPTQMPTVTPSVIPTATPSHFPSSQPSSRPSDQPSSHPSSFPSTRPTDQPSTHPSSHPSSQPSRQPSSQPSSQPVMRPSSQPSSQPSGHPSMEPTVTQTSAAPSSAAAYVYKPAATLPNSKLISVIGLSHPNISSFKIVLPYLVVTPSANRVVYSNIVLPSNGSYGTGFVAFGRKAMPGVVSLPDSSVYSYGFAVSPESSRRSAALLKDFNGDGIHDLVIGDPYLARCYVLFGTEDGLTNMTRGFTIFGESESDLTGWSVSDAGDVNKDSLNDLIIGAPNANGNGAFYVLYGSRRVLYDVFLSNLTLSHYGIAVYSKVKTDALGISVSNAGDVNRDGYDDVIVGAVMTSTFNAGAAYVLYGGNGLQSILDVSQWTAVQGFKLNGLPYSLLGYSVAGVGDVNRDGFADVLIGSCSQKTGLSDAAYLIYGSNVTVSGTMVLSPSSVFRGVYISGAGVMVSYVGDVNRDGYDDILIGGSYDFSNHGTGYAFVNRVGYVASPTISPTVSPSNTRSPSLAPTVKPTLSPTVKATLKPTIQPSFFPSSPTELPTHGATQPTSQPSSNPTFPTLAPSHMPSEAPSAAPSTDPTISPTDEPTLTPTQSPTTSPSLAPTAMPVDPPTLIPSVEPTVSSTRPPKNYPTLMPSTLSPTWNGATPLVVTDAVLMNNPVLVRTEQDLKFVFNCSVDVTVTGVGGSDEFYVIPNSNMTVTVEYFNVSSDTINLEAFTGITKYSQIVMTVGSVLIHLPDQQVMKLSNLYPVNMTADHFVLYKPAEEVQPKNKFIGNLLKVSYAVIAFLGTLTLCLSYYYIRRKRKIKAAVKETTARIARQSQLLALRRSEPIHVHEHLNKNRVYLYTITVDADVKRRDSQPLHLYATGAYAAAEEANNVRGMKLATVTEDVVRNLDELEEDSISFNHSINLSDFSIDSEGNCFAIGGTTEEAEGGGGGTSELNHPQTVQVENDHDFFHDSDGEYYHQEEGEDGEVVPGNRRESLTDALMRQYYDHLLLHPLHESELFNLPPQYAEGNPGYYFHIEEDNDDYERRHYST